MPHLPKSRVVRVLLGIVAAFLIIVVVLIGSTAWLDALGASPKGERLARIQRSPHYRDGAFRNLDATTMMAAGSAGKMLRQWLGGREQRVPPAPMPIVTLTRTNFAQPPLSGLRATWLGHSTVLVEIDGARILFDPVWALLLYPLSVGGGKRVLPEGVHEPDVPGLLCGVRFHHRHRNDRRCHRAVVSRTSPGPKRGECGQSLLCLRSRTQRTRICRGTTSSPSPWSSPSRLL